MAPFRPPTPRVLCGGFALLLATALALPVASLAGAGDLDASFGVGGRAIGSFQGATLARRILTQPGRIVVVGNDEAEFAALIGFTAQGLPDLTFGTNQRALGSFQGAGPVVDASAQPDGRLVVLGGAPGSFLALMRFTADGALDGTFGVGGRTLGAFTGAGTARRMAVAPDASLVVVGDGGDLGFAALMRFDRDGVLDGTFGTGGRVVGSFVGAGTASDVAIQHDGRVVVMGDAPGSAFVALMRFSADGDLDPTFGTGGRTLGAFVGAGALRRLALDADDRIVVLGDGAGPGSAALMRFTADGVIDPTFGTSGRTLDVFLGAGTPRTLAIQTDGRIVVLQDGADLGFAAVSTLTPGGAADLGFGSGGRVVVGFTGVGPARDLTLAADGGILVMGDGGGLGFTALVRLEPGAATSAAGGGEVPPPARGTRQSPAPTAGGPPFGALRATEDALAGRLAATLPPGRFARRLVDLLARARSDTDLAASHAKQGRQRRAARLLTRADHAVGAIVRRLRAAIGTHAPADTERAPLMDALRTLRSMLRAARRG